MHCKMFTRSSETWRASGLWCPTTDYRVRRTRLLGILTPGFESGYDLLKAGDLVRQDVDLMLRAINAVDRKFQLARLKPLQKMAKSGEFVSGRRFVHAQSFTGLC